MYELISGRLPGMLNHGCRGPGRNPPSLIGWQDQPAGFIDRSLAPSFPPVANTAYPFAVLAQNDLEHTVSVRLMQTKVTLVTPENLFLTLGAAKVFHHIRIAQQLLEQGQIVL